MTLRIHFHTDSATFAGCEQMLTVLLPALVNTDGVEVSLSYRSSPEYERGLQSRIDPVLPLHALKLPEVADVEARLKARCGGSALKPVRGVALAVLHGLPVRQAFQLYDVIPLRQLFRSIRPDIVHINNGGFPGAGSANAAAIAARAAGVPSVVYVVNNLAYGYSNPLRWAGFPVDRLVARFTDRFVTGSRVARDQLQVVLGLKSDKLEVIPNSIAQRSPDESRSETRQRLGIGEEEFLLACIARLERRKGHGVLIDALERLELGAESSRVTAVIEGDGPERLAIEADIGRRRGGVAIRMAGTEANIWNLIQAADAIVLPSLDREDFPNVVLEAMSMGKAVVASRVGGTSEQIVDGATGLIVPPGDALALAAAIRKLVSNEALLRRLGENGRTHFDRQFAPEIAVKRYLNLYQNLAGSELSA